MAHFLTEAQEGLWYAQRLDPANPLFQTGHYLDLAGPLDRAAFARAAQAMAGEADALALAVAETPEGVRQWVEEGRRSGLEIVDLSGRENPEAAARAAMDADMASLPDPAKKPLAAQKLLILGPERHFWYLRVHHLAIDGYGMSLLNSRVAALYNGAAGPKLAGLDGVLAEDAAYRDGARRGEDAAFWRDYLAELPEIVGMAPGRAVSAHDAIRTRLLLGPEAFSRITEWAEAQGVSWPDALTGLASAYAQRFAGAPEIVVGVPHMGRLGSAAARVPAMVMNVLPLRVSPRDDLEVGAFVSELARALPRLRRHGRYRSEQMRRDLGLLGGHRRLYGPLVNVMPFDVPPRFSGLDTRMHVLGTGPIEDITVTFRGGGDKGLSLEIEANPGLYGAAEVEAHAARLAGFVEAALGAETLGAVRTATEEEAAREIEAFNRTDHPVPETTLAALLEEGFSRAPDDCALVFGDEELSYGALERRTRALALLLRARGVGPGDVVGVALPRSVALIVALLAVIRAGAAYLPLDPDNPAGRLVQLIEEARPKLVLAVPALADALGGAAEVLAADGWPTEPEEALAPAAAGPGDLAYLLFTSGSTGRPKGVMIEHRAIVNRLVWMKERYGVGPGDRILQKTPMGFDVSVWEFFLPIVSGAALVVAPPGVHREPKALAALIRDKGVTILHFVPSMLSVFLEEPSARGLSLRAVFASGEELSADLAARFHAVIGAALHNLYGPTEAAVDVSHFTVGKDGTDRPVPIGFPVWNTRLYVLDARGHPVPPGATGELHLAGVQLARGYLGRPDLTAEKFVPDPFVPGERMYRTGDLARRRGDGAVLYAGRIDDQVKLRGVRIEPGEVEAALRGTGLVREAAVVLREDRGSKRLVAYLVPGPGYDERTLRGMLGARLPEAMVPAAMVTLSALPLSANGKLDRKALPAPVIEAGGGRQATSWAERRLAALYREVLNLAESPGAEDDFFALGGDSLSAAVLVMRIEEEFGRDPGLGLVFERPEIAALAAALEDEARAFDDGLQPVLRLSRGEAGHSPLVLIHPVGGIAWCYRHLARMLGPGRAVYGLQAPALAPGVGLPDTLDALADDYVARLLDLLPDGPYHLAGWSVGGLIAQAMAARLAAAGREVGVLALLDSYPADCWRAGEEPAPAEALRALLAVAGHVPEEHPELESREDILAFLKAADSPLGRLDPQALDGVIGVVLGTNRLVRGHVHERFAGTLTHFRAALDHRESGLHPDLWAPYAERLEIVDLPFLHREMSGPAASEAIALVLGPLLSAWDAAAEGQRMKA